MKFRITFIQIASFTAGAVLPSLIYGILAFLFVVTTFSFSGQKLSEKENTDAFVFFSIVIIVFATYYVMFKKYRSGKKFTAAGIAIAGLIPIYGLFYSGEIYVSNLAYYKVFGQKIWLEGEAKPFKMAKTLVKKHSLIGLSRQEAVEKLGPNETPCKGPVVDLIIYHTTNWEWDLHILFKNNKVKEAYLYEEGLSN